MPRKARPDSTDPPTNPPRNRRVHRTSDNVWRRGGSEVSLTGEIPAVPDGQAASESGIDTGVLPTIPADGTERAAAGQAAPAGPAGPVSPVAPAVPVVGAASGPGSPASPLDTPVPMNPAAAGGYPSSAPIVLPDSGVPAGAVGGASGRSAVPGPDVADPLAAQESDWMALARQQAELANSQDAVAATWTPGGAEDDFEIDLTTSPSLVRPYARTGGRTRPVRDLDLEALVRTTLAGKEASTSPWLNPEHTSIIEMCSGTVSVAEIAARLAVPLGVARVIIADMVDLGLVEVMKTSAAEGDERDPDFLRRVLSGLQRL